MRFSNGKWSISYMTSVPGRKMRFSIWKWRISSSELVAAGKRESPDEQSHKKLFRFATNCSVQPRRRGKFANDCAIRTIISEFSLILPGRIVEVATLRWIDDFFVFDAHAGQLHIDNLVVSSFFANVRVVWCSHWFANRAHQLDKLLKMLDLRNDSMDNVSASSNRRNDSMNIPGKCATMSSFFTSKTINIQHYDFQPIHRTEHVTVLTISSNVTKLRQLLCNCFCV